MGILVSWGFERIEVNGETHGGSEDTFGKESLDQEKSPKQYPCFKGKGMGAQRKKRGKRKSYTKGNWGGGRHGKKVNGVYLEAPGPDAGGTKNGKLWVRES